MELRERIEALASAKVQVRAHWELDDRLHLMFADASGNAVLADFIRQARVTTRLFEISNPLRRVHQDAKEHLEILEAFRLGDVKKTRRAMKLHIRNLASDTMSILRGM